MSVFKVLASALIDRKGEICLREAQVLFLPPQTQERQGPARGFCHGNSLPIDETSQFNTFHNEIQLLGEERTDLPG